MQLKSGVLLGGLTDPTADKSVAEGQLLIVRMDYHIIIQRQQQQTDGLTRSTLSLNGNVLGNVYESTVKLIPAGVYPGRRLYSSSKNIVQSKERRMGTKGDFLLEIGTMPKRKNALIIPLDMANNVGDDVFTGASTNKGDVSFAPPVLAALRRHFYGTDNTIPLDPLYVQKEKNIRIEVRAAARGSAPPLEMEINESSLPAPLTRPIRLLETIQSPKK